MEGLKGRLEGLPEGLGLLEGLPDGPKGLLEGLPEGLGLLVGPIGLG